MLYKYKVGTTPNRLMKAHRQSIVRELVERESITSQEQLRMRLRERGIDATQATLSRDIRELGLVKRGGRRGLSIARVGRQRRSGAAEVALAGAAAEHAAQARGRAGSSIVLRTEPARRRPWPSRSIGPACPEIAGTIAGDDTILVICRAAGGGTADRAIGSWNERVEG